MSNLSEWFQGLKKDKNVRQVSIVCHDDPDPDAMASALGIAHLCTKYKIDSKIYYGGELAHVQNRVFINVLGISMTRLDGDKIDEIKEVLNNNPIVVVDTSCKTGEGNLRALEEYLEDNKKIDVVIDHHLNGDIKDSNRFSSSNSIYINKPYASCATIIYEILLENRVKINHILATALYFGIENDSNNLVVESTTDNDREAHSKLEKKIDNKLLVRIVNYPLPDALLKLQQKAYLTMEKAGDMIIVGVGFILPSQKSLMADVANNFLRYQTTNHACVMGVIDEGFGEPKKLVVSLRTTGDIINTNEFIQTVFGHGFGGKKGAGGGSIELDETISRRIDTVRDSEDKYLIEFDSIYNGYVMSLLQEKAKIS